ncbi:uncharacterized protein [Leptinotarsa decemlineata]|uniref:uncharacterized protein n=1 Tax=Leptinotarsa decemlineata TaxID=7539 RepID=UPI003D309A06
MEKGNKEKKRRRKLSYQYDESECDEAISLHDDGTDEWDEEVEEVEEDEPKESQEGTFVVVRVSGKMAYRLLVAKIICKSSEGLEVKFYKRVEMLMKFKETDETNYADEEDVEDLHNRTKVNTNAFTHFGDHGLQPQFIDGPTIFPANACALMF